MNAAVPTPPLATAIAMAINSTNAALAVAVASLLGIVIAMGINSTPLAFAAEPVQAMQTTMAFATM